MKANRAKVSEPGAHLVLEEEHVTSWTGTLWRIHRTSGRHASTWNALRTAGPLEGMRWDPQQEDGSLPAHGLRPSVAYTGTTVHGVFAEVFQDNHSLHLDPARALSGWVPTRALRLIDMSGSDFSVHNDAAHVLPSLESKALTRRWAAALFAQFGDRIDGLLHDSTIIGDPVVVLFTGAQDAYPAAPGFSRPLDHVDVAHLAADVAGRLRWLIV